MTYVAWLAELGVKEGELENVRGLMDEIVTAARADEPGTTHYQWSLDENGTTLHLYERYEDSDPALKHMADFDAKFADRFMASLKPVRLTAFGSPNEAVKKATEPTPECGWLRERLTIMRLAATA